MSAGCANSVREENENISHSPMGSSILRLQFCFVLLLVPICAVQAQMLDAPPFSDISAHANRSAITFLSAEGIISGYPDGTFRPDQTINRAEFAKILIGSSFTYQALDTCDPLSFYYADTDKSPWYSPYLCLASQHSIIQGYPDGSFRPSQPINFVEAAKMIAMVNFYFTNGVFYGDRRLPTSEDGTWYGAYVRYLGDAGAIPTSIQSLDQSLTRGEMAEMIYRLKAGVTTKPSGTYEDFVVRSNTFAGWERNEHPMSLPLSYTYPPGWQIDSKGTVQTGSVSTSLGTFDVREERELAGLSPQAASSRDGSFQTIESQGPVTIAGRSGYRLRGSGISGGRSIAQEKTFVAYNDRMFSVTFIDWNLSGNIESSDLYGTYEQMLSSLTFSAP